MSSLLPSFFSSKPPSPTLSRKKRKATQSLRKTMLQESSHYHPEYGYSPKRKTTRSSPSPVKNLFSSPVVRADRLRIKLQEKRNQKIAAEKKDAFIKEIEAAEKEVKERPRPPNKSRNVKARYYEKSPIIYPDEDYVRRPRNWDGMDYYVARYAR